MYANLRLHDALPAPENAGGEWTPLAINLGTRVSTSKTILATRSPIAMFRAPLISSSAGRTSFPLASTNTSSRSVHSLHVTCTAVVVERRPADSLVLVNEWVVKSRRCHIYTHRHTRISPFEVQEEWRNDHRLAAIHSTPASISSNQNTTTATLAAQGSKTS